MKEMRCTIHWHWHSQAQVRPTGVAKVCGTASVPAIDRFHCHAIKNKFEAVQWNKPRTRKCCRRPIHKQPLQVSRLCDASFLSYLPKRRTQLYRVLYGIAMLVDHFGPPRAAGNQQQHLELTLRWKRLLFTRETVHTCTNTSPNILETFKLGES